MEDIKNILKQMAKEDYENGQVFDPDDFSEFQKLMKEQGYDITEDDLVKYYKYVADIAADENGLDDIVLNETEDDICCICGEPIQGYGNNPAPVCDDGVCCDRCNIEKVIPARLSIREDLDTENGSVKIPPQDNGYHDFWELDARYGVHNDGGRFHVIDMDNGNQYIFNSDSIDEVNNYIKTELELNVEIEPSTRVFKKKDKVGGKEVAKQHAIREMANLDFEVGHTFDPDDFNYFKKVCKEDGWDVTEDDFAKYFEYLDEIRSEQYDLDEAILTDEEKFEREIEQLDIKATNFEKLSRESFDKGNEEGGHYYKELADEIRREMDMKSASRSHHIEEGMKGQYTVTGVTTEGTKLYYNADTRDWHEKAEDATMFTDHDIALDSWFVVTNNGKKLPDGFRRIFVPNYVTESLSEGKWNIGSNKLAIDAKEYQRLNELAQMLEDNSPNNYRYEVQKTYEDFGAGMQWYNIVCYNNKGDHWQVLNTKEWLDLMNTRDIRKIYNDIISDSYFQDKKKDIKDMNFGELFDSMDE